MYKWLYEQHFSPTAITLFALAKGQGLSEHTTPFTALVQLVDGQAKIKIGSKTHFGFF